MRLTLCVFITPTWEDVAPEVTVSSVGNTYLQVAHCHQDKLIRHRLCVIWTGGLVVEFRLLHSVVIGSISIGGDHSMHYWWDPIMSKQLFSVPYVACRCLPDFLVMIIQIYIYIYIYTLPAYFSLGYQHYMKYKQPRSGLEFRSQFPFSTMITIISWASPYIYIYIYIYEITWERYRFNYSLGRYGQRLYQTGLFNSDMTTGVEEGKLWIETC